MASWQHSPLLKPDHGTCNGASGAGRDGGKAERKEYIGDTETLPDSTVIVEKVEALELGTQGRHYLQGYVQVGRQECRGGDGVGGEWSLTQQP